MLKHLINFVFRDSKDAFATACRDGDVVVSTQTFDDYLENLRIASERMRQASLSANPWKVQLPPPQVKQHGYAMENVTAQRSEISFKKSVSAILDIMRKCFFCFLALLLFITNLFLPLPCCFSCFNRRTIFPTSTAIALRTWDGCFFLLKKIESLKWRLCDSLSWIELLLYRRMRAAIALAQVFLWAWWRSLAHCLLQSHFHSVRKQLLCDGAGTPRAYFIFTMQNLIYAHKEQHSQCKQITKPSCHRKPNEPRVTNSNEDAYLPCYHCQIGYRIGALNEVAVTMSRIWDKDIQIEGR